MSKNRDLKIRVTDEMRARLEEAQKRIPYNLSLSQIIERGINLALSELERVKWPADTEEKTR